MWCSGFEPEIFNKYERHECVPFVAGGHPSFLDTKQGTSLDRCPGEDLVGLTQCTLKNVSHETVSNNVD